MITRIQNYRVLRNDADNVVVKHELVQSKVGQYGNAAHVADWMMGRVGRVALLPMCGAEIEFRFDSFLDVGNRIGCVHERVLLGG